MPVAPPISTKCSKKEVNRGAWTDEEDQKLAQVVEIYGPKRWQAVAAKAGLNRSGKSCRLRWMNYLRPNIKRGNISDQEEDLILRLHKLLGNRWSLIAGRLPGRTDNEIKNYWNYHLSKKTKQNEKQTIGSRMQESVLENCKQLEPWTDLSGKVVMVTGASSGLGRDFCLDLSKAGCRIVAAARRVDRLKSLCDEINHLSFPFSGPQPSGPRAFAVELDVCADGSTIQSSVKAAWDAFGRIDALINNAGVRGNVKDPLELTEEEWNQNIRTNLTGSWLVSKYVCMLMRDAKQGGSVINISSIAGLNRGQLPGGLAYASSKAGLNAMTKTMAMELGMHKIRVNSISPGLFKSEITEGLLKKAWLQEVATKINPLRTFGTVDPALTSLVRYLIHDSSEYVTGNIFIVDAGSTLPGVPIFSSL